jgi:bacterial/archaeal transporter family-2 protein
LSGATLLAVVATAAGGIAGAVQAAMMGRFGERIGTLEAFAFAAATTGLIGLAILLAARRSLAGYSEALDAPPWLWLAGAMGATVVIGMTFAAPRIGTTATIGILTAGNLATAAVVDRFGLFGLDRIPLTWARACGIGLLAAGAALTLKR